MRHVEGIIGLCLWHCMIAEALKKCPLTVETWNTASMALQCQPPNYYHCIRDENGQITQQCLQRVWIQPDMCPEFNAEAQRIDVYTCKSDVDNCPTATFWSNAIYVYPGCFFEASSTTSGPAMSVSLDSMFPDTSTEAQDPDGATVIVVPVIIVGVLLILAAIAGVVCWRRKHRTDSPGEETGNRFERDIDTQQNEADKMLDSPTTQRIDNVAEVNLPLSETSVMRDDSPKNERYDNSMKLDGQLRDSPTTQRINNVAEENLPLSETSVMRDDSPKNERYDNSMKLDGQLRDYANRLEGLYTDIRICLLLSHTSVSETKIEEASGLMGEKIVIENDFKMWETNKSRLMYFFRNWVDIDQEHCVDEVKGTLIEVLQAVIEKGTKFVIILPLSIWHKDQRIQELRDLPCCKIRY
ncbi:uncharacterized protein LOC125683380 [Ostrea edulis]|uniref:uncharacterized protein LOC125683380 n=1 Tax=Ostrea edulis TaxID=37623 RepID=UPI0020952BB9|nr:uncharacterized protein LOC125683380 [Ostrea edulis]